MPTQASHNHHYIPRFYSKRWAIYGGRLCQYSRPRKLVVPARKYPKQIGFEPNLYTLPGLLKQHQTEIEDKVFRVIDQRASDAVAYLIAHPKGPFSAEIRSDFTRFVMSFLHRTPERVVVLKAKFLAEAAIRNQTMQQEYIDQGRALPGGISFDEFNEQQRRMILSVDWGKLLVRLVDSEFLGQRINDMIWTVRSVAAARLDMLTCDKPVIRTNGFAHAEGHFA